MNITITEACAAQVAKLLTAPEQCLRIFVQGGGCSGFQYGFALDPIKGEDDAVIEKDGVTFLIDYLSAGYLEGSTIDYINELAGSYFSIKNPNAKTTCGCGSSFSA